MVTPETRLKKDLKALLNERGAFWSAIAGGTYAKPGDPDIIACYKGYFIAIEGKTYEGSQSEWQKLRQCQVKKAGGIYAVIRSVDGLRKLLDFLDSIDARL